MRVPKSSPFHQDNINQYSKLKHQRNDRMENAINKSLIKTQY